MKHCLSDSVTCGHLRRMRIIMPVMSWWTQGSLLADMPTCTHLSYSVRILTLKYACTHCCSPGMHFVAFRSSPVSVSMQVQSMSKLILPQSHNNLHVSEVKCFWPVRALHFNTIAHLPLLAKCSTRSVQFSAPSK